ncbi:REP-associated tyrosine transposase [Marivirga harenae]|uniref:REP-associated tyrosine transposase n=1 Tax=Marivirga harenae TaxID=2010992 RepID=UPI0026E00A40|nr:transposase [Marivirga harenae]WKV11495.1 transposase [Marivirga harenae]
MSGDRYKIADRNALYFVTFTVVNWIDVFTRRSYKIEVVNSLNYCIQQKGLKVYAWCLMSNHIHLILSADKGFRLSDIIRDFKKFTAKRILKMIETEVESRREWMLQQFKLAGLKLQSIKKYKFWKDDNHAIELTSKMIDGRVEYIHQNPVKALIVDDAEEYVYSSARDYAGRTGLVQISFLS